MIIRPNTVLPYQDKVEALLQITDLEAAVINANTRHSAVQEWGKFFILQSGRYNPKTFFMLKEATRKLRQEVILKALDEESFARNASL